MGNAKFCSFGNRHGRQTGFSLIELAIVLVIIMSVLTLGMSALNSYMTSSAYSGTKARQARIKDALVAFYGAHKRLPCPAWGSATGAIAPDMRGLEQRSGGACLADTGLPAGFGVVPYATLGLGRDVAEDGWGDLMSYHVYFDATPSGDCSVTGTKIDWTTPNCFGAGKTGGLTVTLETPPLPTLPVTTVGIVAVIISHGKNGFGAWTRQGKQNHPPTPPLCEEAHNAGVTPLTGCADTTSTMFYTGERPENDDVVGYLTANDVIQRLAKQGDILSAAAQVNANLQEMVSKSISTSCTPITALPSNTPLDPWGNSYLPLGSTAYPVCYCSSAGGVAPVTCPGTTTNCQSLDMNTINGYRTKSGLPIC